VIDVARFLLIAEAVLGIDVERLRATTKLGSAESALAAPFASFGGREFYDDPLRRAAVLASRLVRNHPLPDGNKRVALLLMEDYLEDQDWRLVADAVDIDRTFRALAGRSMSEDEFCTWLTSRTERLGH
jgi:death on curing protein